MTREELIEAILCERIFKKKGTFSYSRQRKVRNFLSTNADPVSKSVFRHVKRETNRPRRLGYTYIYDAIPLAAHDNGYIKHYPKEGEPLRTPGTKEINMYRSGFAVDPIWQPKSLKFR